jgi:hypothetical protein
MASSETSAAMDALAARLQKESRPRISQALNLIVIDALCPQARSALSPSDHKWLIKAVSEPVSEATQAALDALLEGLSRTLENGPPGLLAKLEVLRGHAEFGSG